MTADRNLILSREFQAEAIIELDGDARSCLGWKLFQKHNGTLYKRAFTTAAFIAQHWEDKNPEGQRANVALAGNVLDVHIEL